MSGRRRRMPQTGELFYTDRDFRNMNQKCRMGYQGDDYRENVEFDEVCGAIRPYLPKGYGPTYYETIPLEGSGYLGGYRRKKGVPKKSCAKKSTNPWIQHVCAYAIKHKISYKDALEEAGTSWKKMKKSSTSTPKKRKAKK